MVLLKKFLLYAVYFLAIATPLGGSYARYNDAEIQEAYLYHLSNFINWPATIEKQLGKQVTICLLGNFPVSRYATSSKDKQQFIWKRQPAYFDQCTILFIDESERGKIETLLTQLHGKPILTVSNIEKFAKYGGMIGFARINEEIKLEINTQAIAKAGLIIDQHLLELALHVY